MRSAQLLSRIAVVALLAAGAASPLACKRQEAPPALGERHEQGEQPMAMKITSSAFAHKSPMPVRYTGDGQDLSPPLAWSDLPDGTVELAMICDDPDAPRPEPWVHWVIYKIPASATGLGEGLASSENLDSPPGAMQGLNTWPAVGYRGPAPPRGHGVHHYRFHLYALDKALPLQPRMTKAQLLEAMRGHILAEAELVGTYER